MALTAGALLLTGVAGRSVSAQSADGAVGGTVRDTSGLPLSGATIALEAGGGRATMSDAAGVFRLGPVPAGPVALVVRRLGFRPQTHRIELAPGATARLDVRLVPLSQALAPMVVQARREVYDSRLEGFRARSESGAGHFIGRDKLERSGSLSLPDLLQSIPGVRLGPPGGMQRSIRFRGNRCAPLVFIDGYPASAGEFDLQMLNVMGIEGVEVYLSMATVPPEFGAAGMKERCGVIAVWSRPSESRRRRDDTPVNVEALVASGQVFTVDEVASPAQLDSSQGGPPVYPDSLWRAGVGGQVLVELVVDSAGLAEPGTIRVVSATHVQFGVAVVRSMAEAVFEPARLRGRRVRQLVQIPVVFRPGELLPMAGLPPL